MSHVLLIVRHAKTEAGASDDAARRLTPRGVRDARAIGGWLAGNRLWPERVVVSPARRAQQTWHAAPGAAAAAGGGRPAATPPEVLTDPRIYDNTPDALLAVLQETPDAVGILALVGHNPSVAALAKALPGAGSEAGFEFGTAGIAVFDVDGSWSELDAGRARLRSFTVARG